MQYRRANTAGGTYFFTVNLADRSSDLLVRRIDDLRSSMQEVKQVHPFTIEAMVVMPDHLHAIWRLPVGDANYPLRWSQIKACFSRRMATGESISTSRLRKRERGIWQRRYWEHQLRDDADLAQHIEYIHYNPVRHGWVSSPVEWPYSSLHTYIDKGIVTADWGVAMNADKGGYGER